MFHDVMCLIRWYKRIVLNWVPEYFGAVPLVPLEGATDYHLVARVTHLLEHVCQFIAAQLVFVIFMPLLRTCVYLHRYIFTLRETVRFSTLLYSFQLKAI